VELEITGEKWTIQNMGKLINNGSKKKSKEKKI
jgi:hypothetical protein